MSSQDPLDDIPPAPPRSDVAQGRSEHGERWTVRVGGTRDHCYTFLHIELPDGQQSGGGGMNGPALPPRGFINFSVHSSGQSGASVSYMVGRVHPAVRRVHLEFAGDVPGLDLDPVGESAEFGVSFVAAVLPRSADLASVAVFDHRGELLDRQDRLHYGEAPPARHLDAASISPAARERSGWRPLNGS